MTEGRYGGESGVGNVEVGAQRDERAASSSVILPSLAAFRVT